jgi:diguanylate cyclase (GGDEF)-like protein
MTEAIRSAVRADDIVGRIGGEEFAVFLPGANDNEAMMVAERIRAAVEKLEFYPGEGARRHPLTVSIGGVAKVGDATLSQIMTLADRNLYQAKENGRNKVVLAGEISQAA